MSTLLSLPGLINLGLSLLIPPLGLLLLIPLAIVLNVYHWATLATRWLLLRAPSPALSWRYSSRDKVVVITGASSGIGEDIDFWGNVWPTVFAMPYLRRSHGQVVVMASVAAYLTYPRQSMYNAAKAAIVQFYATLRAEVHPEEMAITIAMPGFVHSELTSRADASTHIPWWWPMLSTPEAARIIVRAAELRQRHVIVPFWYSAWLLYRLFAAQVMDWSQRVMLLGRAPSRFVKGALAAAVGEEGAEWLFRSVAAMAAKGKGKVE
ncbi:unnamed protein product [Closterium sp. NIES-54]